ncbi:unnamed protein product [Larinioides sclopetarius]|uniref:Uncharacterized protein n=1 Tax=Larinioides sclopetarius TaxID=280406 RepID=A0AAV1ZWT4_9ARAC
MKAVSMEEKSLLL